MSNHGDMQRVNGCFWRKNRSGDDFVGDDADLRVKREQRNSVQGLQPFSGKRGVAGRRLINHVLRRYKFIIAALVVPPLVCQKLTGGHDNLRAETLPQVADDGSFDVQRRHRLSTFLAAVAKAAYCQFVDSYVHHDSSREENRALDILVLIRDGRIVSCFVLSDTLKNVPIDAADDVLIAPHLRADTEEWLRTRRDAIIAAEPESLL